MNENPITKWTDEELINRAQVRFGPRSDDLGSIGYELAARLKERIAELAETRRAVAEEFLNIFSDMEVPLLALTRLAESWLED